LDTGRDAKPEDGRLMRRALSTLIKWMSIQFL
jgi:hypothetical protein